MRRDPLACACPFAHVGSAAARKRSPQNWVMSCPRPSSTSRRSAPSAPLHGDRRHRRHAMQRMDPRRAHHRSSVFHSIRPTCQDGAPPRLYRHRTDARHPPWAIGATALIGRIPAALSCRILSSVLRSRCGRPRPGERERTMAASGGSLPRDGGSSHKAMDEAV